MLEHVTHGCYTIKKARGRINRNLLYCLHCKELVTKSTYYRHKNKYYNRDSKTWTILNNESVLSSTSSSDEDCGVHYSEDGVINNDGDVGEQLQVSDTGEFEDQYGSCESTNATILRDESLDEGNDVIYGLIHMISRHLIHIASYLLVTLCTFTSSCSSFSAISVPKMNYFGD